MHSLLRAAHRKQASLLTTEQLYKGVAVDLRRDRGDFYFLSFLGLQKLFCHFICVKTKEGKKRLYFSQKEIETWFSAKVEALWH